MNYKKYIAAVMALSMATGVAGCGSSSNSSSKAEDDFSATENVAVADTESIEAIPEGAEKEILYLGEGDLNPTKGSPEKSTELQLFESKGGKIRFQQTSNEDRFDNLAAAITANKDIPDIFKYEWLAFPSQVVKDMYQPIDSLVDFSQPLWSAQRIQQISSCSMESTMLRLLAILLLLCSAMIRISLTQRALTIHMSFM